MVKKQKYWSTSTQQCVLTVGVIKKYTLGFLKTIVILYNNYGFTIGQSTKRWFYGAT